MRKGDLFKVLKALDVEVVHVNSRGWAVCHCPFAEFLHERGTDANPSFNVKINDQGISGFKCHSCKQSGSVLRLVNKLAYYHDTDYNHIASQVTLLEVPETLPDFDCMQEEQLAPSAEPLNQAVYLGMYPRAWDDSKEARQYLAGRKIGPETARLLELRYDPEAQRILFPVFDYKRQLFGLTGRSIIPDAQRPRDVAKVKNYYGLRKELRLLGEQLIEPGKPLFVVEGLFGFGHLIEIGAREICNPVATMGSVLSVHQRDLIISHDCPAYLAYDDDLSGNQGLYGLWDPRAQTYEGGGAIDLLREHTPTHLALFPERTSEIDDLTFEELEQIIERDFELQ